MANLYRIREKTTATGDTTVFKMSTDNVSGLSTVATSGSYNDLSNIPVISQDLTASGFTPVANTYYKHTGTTTASYTNGVIYYYNSTGYAALDGSASHIVYNNANSGLTATNLQGAVDEMCQRLLTTEQFNKLVALLNKLTVANDSVSFNTIVKATTFDVQ